MSPEDTQKILDTIKDSIAVGIETNVNGKIRAMNAKLDEYIKSDDEWKASVTPSIDTMKELQNFTTVGISGLKLIALVGGIIIGCITLLNVFNGK